MTVHEQFANLNGSEVSREVLKNIISEAKKENETEIVYRLSKVLLDNPDSEDFYIELKQYPTALNAPRHKGLYKEALTECGRLKKGWKFENGTVVKIPTARFKKGDDVFYKSKYATVTKVERPKKKSAQYGAENYVYSIKYTKSNTIAINIGESKLQGGLPSFKDTSTPQKKAHNPTNESLESFTKEYTFKASDIPYDLAYNAHRGTSFSPEKRAKSEQNEYYEHLKSVYDNNLERSKKYNVEIDVFKTGFARYQKGYLKRYLDYLSSRSGLVSTMITGASNFPVARMRKKNDVIHKRLTELVEYSNKYDVFIKSPKDAIIKTGSSEALEQLEKKLENLQEQHALMKKGNAVINKVLRKKGLTREEQINEIAKGFEDFFTEKTVSTWYETATSSSQPLKHLAFYLTNLTASIRRVKEQISLEKRLKARSEEKGNTNLKFAGGEIIINREINKVQIYFEDKPDAEIRSFIKKAGHAFKWSPSQGLWQRQLNTYRYLKELQLFLNNKAEEELKALGVPYIQADDDELKETDGLGKPVSPDQIYQMITDKMIEKIELAAGHGIEKPWQVNGFLNPTNFESKANYRGINAAMLAGTDKKGILKNPYFLTFKQVQKYKGKVKKGAKGIPVVYFTNLYTYFESQADESKKQVYRTYSKAKMVSFIKKKGHETHDFENVVTTYPILKYYNVFNGEDVEGIDFDLDNLTELEEIKLGKIKDLKDFENKEGKNNTAELIIENIPTPKPTFYTDLRRAAYLETEDTLSMPPMQKFKNAIYYYSVFFHELTHSTGHRLRLNRELGYPFGTEKYAKEELIAEFGAVFLSSQAGFLWQNNTNHAEYLKNWKSVIKHAKKDNKLIMRCASAAQKAADFLLNLDAKGNPAFYKFLSTSKTLPAKKKTTKPPAKKVNKKEDNGQLTLALNKPKKGLGNPMLKSNSLASKLAQRSNRTVTYYEIDDKNIADFLGKIEKKEKESVVITVTGGQGSMKTRFAFRFMDALAKKYRVGHASIEEHPDSSLYWNKVHEYISEISLHNISNPEISNVNELDKLIQENEVIVIDSFAKMQELERGFEVDKDLRKKYDGKLFLVIFQQTADGKMRGGTKSQYDADIVLFTEKFDNYEENFVYADKNRYQNKTLCDLQYNIFKGKLNEINSTE